MNYEHLQEAAEAIAARTGRSKHDAAVVLGSGLGDYASTLPGATEIPYSEIPHFPEPQVVGHGGSLFSAPIGNGAVLLFAGRVHTYEGWDLSDVVFGVRTAALTGVTSVILTNAAGGLGEGLAPGDLVAISDHINFTARNPLAGPNDDRLGPRFPDLSEAYSKRLRSRIREAFEASMIPYKEGVYAWFLGPTYETPAEVEMVRRIGGDLVGMSTVPEAIALNHMGVDVAGISLVTNYAAGIIDQPLSHEEVTETAAEARGRFTAVVDTLLPLLVTD
ncbi:MAG: purine-nucleoside phosphorylase [Actinomycetota bacterium]